MYKSKYPAQIDTSVELPTVRDNVTEISSDVFNSFKSAIIQIEKTLGINPQGSSGNTVASRLNRVLDSNGNLLPSAIAQSGVLTGPITNNEVSEYAAISERKLNLNFPTQLLQDEISMLQSEISQYELAIQELLAGLSSHTVSNAANRHTAYSISVLSNSTVPSDIATLQLEANTLQETLNNIYNKHINYTGLNISSTNNSHTAQQIYFDNSSVQELVNSSDVQGAIEDIADASNRNLVETIYSLNSDGLLRRGIISDDFNDSDFADTVLVDSPVNYTQANGATKTSVIFTDQPLLDGPISQFDILKFSGLSDEEDDIEYLISDATYSTLNLVSINIFGGPKNIAVSGLTATIYKNKFATLNSAGLLSTVRPRHNKSNTPDIQIANPNSATIISSNINPKFITSSEHKFNITLDDGSAVTIDTYDSNVTTQTLDTIVNKINEQCVDNKYNFMAYKFRANTSYELALIHNMPNFDDYKNRTLKIELASSNDNDGHLGLSHHIDTVYEGISNNKLLLNGKLKNIFGNILTYTDADISINIGASTITLLDSTFILSGVRVGDLVVIESSGTSSDNGTYRINSISGDTCTLDGSYLFAGELTSSSKVYILSMTVNIGELSFAEIQSSYGTILFDVFIDENLKVFYWKRLEIDGEIRSGGLIGSIVDVSKNFFNSLDEGELNISTDGYAHIVGPDSLSGQSVYIGAGGDYKLFAADNFSYITLRVSAFSTIGSPISLTIYGFGEIGKGGYLLSRGAFSTTLGRVIGYPTESGVPYLIDKRKTGSVDDSVISESFIEKYIEGPRGEIISSGIIRGIELSNIQLESGYQTFDISAGVALINGKRIEFPGRLNNRINSENDFYVVLDFYGTILASESISYVGTQTLDLHTTVSPYYDSNVAVIGMSESQVEVDLRIFIDNTDLKATNNVVVSNNSKLGNFTQLSSAINYCSRFTKLYPDAGPPNIFIKPGQYEVSSALIIDFDLNIIGSGSNTLITKTDAFSVCSTPSSGNMNPADCVFYIGNLDDSTSERIVRGVSISDLSYVTNSNIEHLGAFIVVADSIEVSKNKLFRFSNINATGPSTIAYNVSDGDIIGEYFVVVGWADPDTYTPVAGTFGNIIITNCILKRMGIEYGSCQLKNTIGSTYQNIIATNNISLFSSPNESDTSFEIFSATSNPTISGLLEVSNIVS